MSINYVKGDATKPITVGQNIIVHICNDIGKWGKGFVMCLSRKWPKVKKEYIEWYKNSDSNNFKLGEIQIIKIDDNTYVCNMICERDIKHINGIPPIRYEALEECLNKLCDYNYNVHMPRIGCGLAGGKWEIIEDIINKTLIKNNIPVYVYDL